MWRMKVGIGISMPGSPARTELAAERTQHCGVEMTGVHHVPVSEPARGLLTAYALKRISLDLLVLEKTSAVGDLCRDHYGGMRIPSQS